MDYKQIFIFSRKTYKILFQSLRVILIEKKKDENPLEANIRVFSCFETFIIRVLL